MTFDPKKEAKRIAKQVRGLQPDLETAKQRELELLAGIELQRDYIKKFLPLCSRCENEKVGVYYYHDEDGEEWCCEECHKAEKNFYAYGGNLDEFIVVGLELVSKTPSQALREHEAKLFEEVLDTFAWFSTEEGFWLAEAIRRMAEERRKK